MSSTITYRSPFKINLGLEVLHKRADGYHEINTVFYRFDEPYDLLSITPSTEFSFSTSDPNLPLDEKNLVVRAFSRCAETVGEALPRLAVVLDKVIPQGAGLGGGSADAATAIKMYSEHVRSLSLSQQLEIAGSLGADVPFFLHSSRAMRASGIGDILEAVDLSLDYPCLVIKPRPLFTSTSASYQGLKVTDKKSPTDLVRILQRERIESWQEKVTNDFEPLVFHRYPELKEVREQLREHRAQFVLMSGSGAAIYGLFANESDLQSALRYFQQRYPDGFVAVAR